ncbi:MAG: glutathione peroxidase [Gemella sp.]|nr:glutathione peroxidase [Gemella sp.]
MLKNIELILNNKQCNLQDFSNHTILIVNTASKCGLATQFNELENLYQKYKDDKFIILGFPSNQFKQEDQNDNTIVESCQINFGVTFPLHKLCDVNGKNEHPIFTWLKSEKRGFFTKDIKWNFTKFLINSKGEVIKRYSPTTQINKIEADLIKILK